MYNDLTLGSCAILCVVLLRLAIGWHFYSEGTKKLAPGFSSANFLRQAKGPLAHLYWREVPGGYDWHRHVAVPLDDARELTPDEVAENKAWTAAYGRALTAALKSGDPLPADFSPFPPHVPSYEDWANEIRRAWGQVLKQFGALPELTDEQRTAAKRVFDRRLRQLAEYLADNQTALEDYRHELGRIEKWSADDETGSLPYHDERIAKEQATANALVFGWVREVDGFGDGLRQDLLALLTPAQRDSSGQAARVAVSDPQSLRLERIDTIVTWWTILVGGCLLLGFLTPLAAIAGAAFLLAVMASQPPWVAGAITDYFYYQLVELTALLALAAIGAGRWGGFDMFLSPFSKSCCQSGSSSAAGEAP